MKIRVYYEDTDAGGIVYHSNYLNFCERARSEIFFQNGHNPHDNTSGFVVSSANCNFIKSAKLGDIIEVKSTIINQRKTSLKIQHKIYHENIVIFEADIVVVWLNIKSSKIIKIPQYILDLLL